MARITNNYSQDFDQTHRIPPELWAEIFRHACEINTSKFVPGSLNPINPLLAVRNVCHRWRAILQSLPEVWTKILLNDCWCIPKGTKQDLPSFISTGLRLLSDILHYSKDKPLHIILAPPHRMDTAAMMGSFMLVLAQHCPRWTRLDIHECDNQAACRAIASSLSLLHIDELPSLEDLFISRWNNDDYVGLPYARNGLPKLRTLSVQSGCPELSTLPWEQVEIVKIDNAPIVDYRRVLPGLQSAVNIEIAFGDEPSLIEDAFLDDEEEFTLVSLVKFEVELWDFHFYPLIEAPNIRTLIVRWMVAEHLPTVADFIARSHCSITEFTCTHLICDPPSWRDVDIPDAIISLLSNLPDVRTLKLTFEESEDYGVEELIGPLSQRNGGHISYCPRLRELDISCSALTYRVESMTAYVDMIEMRWMDSKHGNPGLLKVSTPAWRADRQGRVEGFEDLYHRMNVMGGEGLEQGDCMVDL